MGGILRDPKIVALTSVLHIALSIVVPTGRAHRCQTLLERPDAVHGGVPMMWFVSPSCDGATFPIGLVRHWHGT
jgi:hypothetical protein